MTSTLLHDAKLHPHAFRFSGPLPLHVITEWQLDHNCVVPPDLIDLWTTLGGGVLFESETILDPREGDEHIDDENEALISMGLPFDLLVFHRGSCVTAIEQPSGAVVVLDPETYRETARFTSLDDWYRQQIRREFADRYGLDGS